MTNTPANKFRRYDSAALPRGKTVEGWLGMMAQHVLNIDIESHRAARFHASIDIVELASLAIVEFKIPQIVMRRAPRHLDDGNDGFALSIVTAGQFSASQAQNDVLMNTGSAVLMSSRLASDLACQFGGRFWGVKLPRKWFASRQMHCPDDVPIKFASSAALELLVRYADGVLACHRGGASGDAALFESHLSDLIQAALEAPGGGPIDAESFSAQARFAAVRDAISSHAGNPEFSLAHLARYIGMSERTIQSILAKENTSFSDVLRSRRLDIARSLIVNGSVPKVAIAAFEAGFRDLSTFNRSFRKQFGVRPTDLIKRRTT